MRDVGRHPNITLLSYSEVEAVFGYVGNFDAQVRRKARYADEDACTSWVSAWKSARSTSKMDSTKG